MFFICLMASPLCLPSCRLQHGALLLLQPVGPHPPQEHLHRKQRLRGPVLHRRHPTGGRQGRRTSRETPSTPAACPASQPTSQVTPRLWRLRRTEPNEASNFSCFWSFQEEAGLCGEPPLLGERHPHRRRRHRGENRPESKLCRYQQHRRHVLVSVARQGSQQQGLHQSFNPVELKQQQLFCYRTKTLVATFLTAQTQPGQVLFNWHQLSLNNAKK